MQATVASLPASLRDALREPLGPVVTDVDSLLSGAEGPVIAIGDIVTYHLLEAGVEPLVAVIDGRTERRAVEASVRDALPLDAESIPNEPGTLSAELVAALVAAVDSGDPGQVICVDGEEDLAALPALLAAPTGAIVVYGQPGEGMVRAVADESTRERARSLLAEFDETDRLWSLLP
ncbi:MAG: GTP-dependent dephospho-CoA kinase family protein [Halobacteriaceae archaeon]